MILRSVFNAAGVLTLALAVVGPVKAQQVTGVLGSPGATTTVSNKQLPAPDPKFGGVIKDDALNSKAWWAPRVVPPKVLGTPKPASSVMISSTLGAPLGGTTRGAHQGFDCSASSLITPPNLGSGAGNCLLLTVVVALGEPSTPVTCCAFTGPTTASAKVSTPATLNTD